MLSKNYSINDFIFDDEKKEVIFNRYDMPTPWMNYLSNGTFHTMISQAGGALAFYRSPQIWRINRYRFFHLPTDRGGLYIYIRDKINGEYYSLTAEPCTVKPEKFTSAHGMGYTRFETEFKGLNSNLTYFVSPTDNTLVLNLKLKNNSTKTKELQAFSYIEFALMEFMREMQWQCYNKHQVNVYYRENSQSIVYEYAVEDQPKQSETPLVFFATDQKLIGYDGDRERFVGSYRSESNPLCVEEGCCTNSTLRGGDPCGALQISIVLAPLEIKEINFYLGTAKDMAEVEISLKKIRESEYVNNSFSLLKSNFNPLFSSFSCEIPDIKAQRMINIWNPYQVWYNYIFSRNISYYATGTFRGTGYRDTAQDIIAMSMLNIELAKKKTRELLSQQYYDGHVNHYYFPIEGYEPVKSIHSDDHLWSIMTVYSIIAEEGKADFLNEVIDYYDSGSDTVYNHLKKAVNFTCDNLGERGFPLMLHSDWNDSLFRVCRKGKGESIWTSMQLGFCLKNLIEMAEFLEKNDDAIKFNELYNAQKALVNSKAWDGNWYRRAITDEGRYLGTNEEPQAKIWLNSQTWAVMSGYADYTYGIKAMDSVKEYLDTDLGIKKIHPSMENYPSKEDPLTNYNKGTSENGGIFCHANTWAIIAECMLCRPENAWKYYSQLIPQNVAEKAGVDIYKVEPYVYTSNIFGPESDKFGYANVSWLTGAAAWMYIAVTQYILGLKPTIKGLLIKPCVPSNFNGYKCSRVFRGCKLELNFEKGIDKGVYLNDVRLKDNIITVNGQKTMNLKIIY